MRTCVLAAVCLALCQAETTTPAATTAADGTTTPAATTAAAATTTPAATTAADGTTTPAATTAAPTINVLKGDMDLKVDDVDGFANSPAVKRAVQEGLAATVGVPSADVVIESIEAAPAGRRLAQRRLAAGSVKVKYSVVDKKKKIDPAAVAVAGAAVKTNTNAALKKAGKTAKITVTPVLVPPTKSVMPVATTTAKPKTTVKPKTTAAPKFYTEIFGEMVLDVTDTDEFLTKPTAVAALQQAIASLLAIPHKDVEITSMALVAAAGRRLKGSAAGQVKAGFKGKAPNNKACAAVPGMAPNLPAAANKNLAKNGFPAKVGKATIPKPTCTLKPITPPNPCKAVVPVVVAPPVVPASPCAPVAAPVVAASPCAPVVAATVTTTPAPATAAPASPCGTVAPVPVATPAPASPCGTVAPVASAAPVMKFSEQGQVSDQSLATSAGPSMLWLAVPGLLGMIFLVHKGRRRQSETRAPASYASMASVEDGEGLE